MATSIDGLCRDNLIVMRSELLERGYDDRTIARARRAGELIRVGHGAYTLPELWDPSTPEERHLFRAAGAMRRAGRDTVLSHTTAAIVHGATTWGADLMAVHLSALDRRAGRRTPHLVQHRGVLDPTDVLEVGPWTCTDATRTALDVTTILGVEQALVIVDSLLHEGATTLEELREEMEKLRHVPGSLTTDLVLRLAEPKTESCGETRTRFALWRQHVPKPIPQLEIWDSRGRSLGRVDFAWPELRVFVEFDGRKKYTKLLRPGQDAADVVLAERDRERAICRETGWVCVRFEWADLARPAWMAQQIREASLEAGRAS